MEMVANQAKLMYFAKKHDLKDPESLAFSIQAAYNSINRSLYDNNNMELEIEKRPPVYLDQILYYWRM